jgi:hypothetical protein
VARRRLEGDERIERRQAVAAHSFLPFRSRMQCMQEYRLKKSLSAPRL